MPVFEAALWDAAPRIFTNGIKVGVPIMGTPDSITTLAIGLGQELSHQFSNCKSQQSSSESTYLVMKVEGRNFCFSFLFIFSLQRITLYIGCPNFDEFVIF